MTNTMNIDTMTAIYEGLGAELASVRSAVHTRAMGHSSYVTKAFLKRKAIELRAMRALAIRVNEFHTLDTEFDTALIAVIESAESASR
jgi:hypothetical protein